MKNQLPDKAEFLEKSNCLNREGLSRHYNVSKSTIDRWSKKLSMPLKTFKYKDIKEDFTFEQIEIIHGSLLGDCSLTSVGVHGRKNSKLCETHSIKQLGLLEWKKEKLLPFPSNLYNKKSYGRKEINGKIVEDKTCILESCVLETIVHPKFTELESAWYLRKCGKYVLNSSKRRIKIIPQNFKLSLLSLAVWFFDDGSINVKNRQATFNSQSFTKEECDKLRYQMKELGIKNCTVSKNRNKPIIMVNSGSFLDLIDVVKPYLPSKCMNYKIDLSNYKEPNYTTRFGVCPNLVV